MQDRYFHISCFKCRVCQSSLAQGGFFCKDGDYYCTRDYQERFGTKCSHCGRFVEGEVVTALGKTYHSGCFTCARCRSFTRPAPARSRSFPICPLNGRPACRAERFPSDSFGETLQPGRRFFARTAFRSCPFPVDLRACGSIGRVTRLGRRVECTPPENKNTPPLVIAEIRRPASDGSPGDRSRPDRRPSFP